MKIYGIILLTTELKKLDSQTEKSKMRGSCQEFCPSQESKLRIREKLLNFYELKNGEKHTPGILVKAFARSAAGVKVPNPRSLRTEQCLQRTIDYLLTDILLDKRKPFHFAFDFIFDRLRAIRQEAVMQCFNSRQSIKILEPIIMFLAYSRYRLCEEAIQNFDPKICDQHLQECLKRILLAYDELEMPPVDCTKRCLIEALYQVHNLGSTTALSRCLLLPDKIRRNEVFALVYKIAKNYHQGNLFRVVRNISQLPHIICAVASLQMQSIRRRIYQIFSHAYSSKQLTVPVEFLCSIVLQTKPEIISDCKYYNLSLTAGLDAVHFFRSDFNVNLTVLTAKHEAFVEEKLKQISLSDILRLKHL